MEPMFVFKRAESDPLIYRLFRQTLTVMIIAELATSVATMLDGISSPIFTVNTPLPHTA